MGAGPGALIRKHNFINIHLLNWSCSPSHDVEAEESQANSSDLFFELSVYCIALYLDNVIFHSQDLYDCDL